ncbi:STAS domain-containing protein [Sorangium sp. So ce302]|uniref:STAS domain-containing protein n=1 Tax=Sorangium sp. So ce302 TaxID=3133297 RepID=UPI003F6199F6
MAPQLSAAGCSTEIEMDEPVVGYSDTSRLEQVLLNRLSNAMKYGRRRPIHVGVRKQAASAWITVREQRIGTAEEAFIVELPLRPPANRRSPINDGTALAETAEYKLLNELIGCLAHGLSHNDTGSSRAPGARVILDVTGVSVADEIVSGYLLKAVRAARLLGAACSFVGISPAMAQALTQLGLDWSGVETFRDLRAGLKAAIAVRQRAPARARRAAKPA